MRPGREIALALLVTAAFLGAPSAADASDWYINGSVANNTGSEADNCPGADGVGCVTVGPGNVSLDDASHVVLPTSPLAAGAKGSFSFVAEGLWKGADMYARYTMPDQSTYEIVAEDDVGSGGTSGNYAACSEPRAQESAYVCSAVWRGPYEEMKPAYTFARPAEAPTAAAGQVCSGDMGGSSPTFIECTAAGEFGVAAPSGESGMMMLTFADESSRGVEITAQGNPNYWYHTERCLLAQWADQCHVYLSHAASPWNITISPTGAGTSEEWYGVQILGEAQSYEEDVPTEIPTWPPGESDTANPQPVLSALSIGPAGGSASATRSGPSRIGAGGAATISYRDSRRATTVFTLARAVPGGNRWVPVGHRNVVTSLTIDGVRRGHDCRRGAHAGSPGCLWRMTLTGQLAHRDHRGRNLVQFHATLGGRLGGRPLRPGLYRLTARARAASTTSLSRPRSVRFRVG